MLPAGDRVLVDDEELRVWNSCGNFLAQLERRKWKRRFVSDKGWGLDPPKKTAEISLRRSFFYPPERVRCGERRKEYVGSSHSSHTQFRGLVRTIFLAKPSVHSRVTATQLPPTQADLTTPATAVV